MRRGAGACALAKRFPLPELWWRSRLRICSGNAALLAVPGMPAADLGDLGVAHGAHPIAPDKVALGDLPGHPVKDPDFRTGVAAPSGYLLAGRLAAAPQTDGGQGALRRCRRDARQQTQRVCFDPVTGFSYAGSTAWAVKALIPGAVVTSDGLFGFEVLHRLGFERKDVIAGKGKVGCEVDAFKWLKVILGNLKTSLSGTHHAFAFRKYAHRYLAEVQYRFNSRFDLGTMVTRLASAIMQAKPCSRARIQMSAEIET